MSVPPIEVAGFATSASFDAQTVRVTMTGTADVRAVDSLERFMPELHTQTLLAKANQVVVDLLALEFMNSSCFKSLVAWIAQLREIDPAQRYHVTFLSSTAQRWQRRSLHALSSFAPELVTVETPT
jgi:hypothetical protein